MRWIPSVTTHTISTRNYIGNYFLKLSYTTCIRKKFMEPYIGLTAYTFSQFYFYIITIICIKITNNIAYKVRYFIKNEKKSFLDKKVLIKWNRRFSLLHWLIQTMFEVNCLTIRKMLFAEGSCLSLYNVIPTLVAR